MKGVWEENFARFQFLKQDLNLVFNNVNKYLLDLKKVVIKGEQYQGELAMTALYWRITVLQMHLQRGKNLALVSGLIYI